MEGHKGLELDSTMASKCHVKAEVTAKRKVMISREAKKGEHTYSEKRRKMAMAQDKRQRKILCLVIF